jgi:GWxTD domain-containing protein
MNMVVILQCFLLLVWTYQPVWAQVETAKRPSLEDLHPYNVDAICFVSSDSGQSRLDVFIQVPYEGLTFLKTDDAYLSSYEITIDLLDSTGGLYAEKLWTEEVRVATFEESVSADGYSLTQRVFYAPPGKYTLLTVVQDHETRVSQRRTRPIVVPDLSQGAFTMSEMMIVSRITMVDERKLIVPFISSNVGAITNEFHLFFEVYNREGLASVAIVTKVFDQGEAIVYFDQTLEKISAGRNQLFVRVNHTGLAMGEYVVQVQAFAVEHDSATRLLASNSRSIMVKWRGMPVSFKDLALAIEQLQYIANPGEEDYISEATTEEEKKKRFLEFWKKRDPNPNTPRNEVMEEYYGRVEYANKHFQHYIEGWRTDMGMVYISFGAPNNVDRHPFDINSKPYEVWSYYDLNHQFVFVDETGFGDYRLTTPIWEVWRRPR